MSKFLKNICRLPLYLIFLSSCEAAFNPNITSEPTPVVYGIISPQDSLYSVRLTKTFNGAGSALDFAQIPDSIYYRNARVFLETRDLNGKLFEKVELEEKIIDDRLPGKFATTPNRIFQTDASKIHLRPGYFEAAGKSYDLNLNLVAIVPGSSDTVRAVTRLRSVPRLTEPKYTFVKVYFYTEAPFFMEWLDTNAESYFQILVRIHYTDYLYDDQREMTAEWVLSGITTNMVSFPGGTRKAYSYYFRPENFYAQVARAIPVDKAVEARICNKLDFAVLSSNREMQYYRDVYEISDDYHGSGYTNVQNGFGIFTTFSSTGIYGLELGSDELDSLANGKYTKLLKFKHY